MCPTKTITVFDDETAEQEIELRCRWEICDRCEGEGTVDHPAFSNGITAEEFGEWDDEDRITYMRGGYDVPCSDCKGTGKVAVIDEDRIPVGLKEKYEQWVKDQEELAASRAQEEYYWSRGIEW